MRILRRGDVGPEVGLLRRLLNRKLKPSPNLSEANIFSARYNGATSQIDFGPKTEAAVRAFQRANRLKEDCIVGPKTWSALGLTIDINRPVIPANQPTDDTCYAAAATMVLGPQAGASFEPGPAPAGRAPDDFWAESFSRQFNWQLEYGMTPLPIALARYLHPSPFWFAGNLPFPSGPGYHAVVVGAIWGDGDTDRTMLLIYDPWPPNVGEIYGIMLGDYTTRNPLAFRYILHK